MNIYLLIISAVSLAVVFFFVGYFSRRIFAEQKIKTAEDKAKAILEEAKKYSHEKRKETDLEAKDLLIKTKTEFDKETKEIRSQLMAQERRLSQREENLDRKVDIIDKKERKIIFREKQQNDREKNIEAREHDLERLIMEEKEKLQKVSGLSADQAKKLLLERIEQDITHDVAVMVKKIEERTKEGADKKAREIISLAIQRCAAEHTVDSTVSVVSLPRDEMKGRIIGREGRNIRALETMTGVEVVIDDTPEAVTLSGFDPIRREIARISLERLISDGRIHPARIEEIVEKVKKEMDVMIREEGERAVFDVGVQGVHPEIIKLLGRLKYRTSYSQNVLQHSKEVAYIMGVMASELTLDFNLARRIGLLHDIGKAIDHEIEGTHAKIGADLARKYNENQVVVNAVGAHHHEMEGESLYAVLVEAADAISAARPGARRETIESYIKRLEKLESIADAFRGVEKAYAIQAGREIRVIVHPDKIDDAESAKLARDITKKIETELEYPGQIKVTVIREKRVVEYAK
ncbi:MAG: ribonuclease Y [Candidatus Omnitrophota bacterium]